MYLRLLLRVARGCVWCAGDLVGAWVWMWWNDSMWRVVSRAQSDYWDYTLDDHGNHDMDAFVREIWRIKQRDFSSDRISRWVMSMEK